MADWIFAFFHLALLLGLTAYSLYSLFRGEIFRSGFIILFLAVYYFLVLHKPVKKEISRKKMDKRQ